MGVPYLIKLQQFSYADVVMDAVITCTEKANVEIDYEHPLGSYDEYGRNEMSVERKEGKTMCKIPIVMSWITD